jgi:cell division transport system permease protein
MAAPFAFAIPAHDRKLIPDGRFSGTMSWVMAIMLFLTLLAAAAAIAIGNAASQGGTELARDATVQLVDTDPAERAAQQARIAKQLRSMPGVSDVRPVPERESRALLEPWLGDAASDADIPVPALIDVSFVAPPTKTQLSRLQTTLAASAPGLRIDSHASWMEPFVALMQTMFLLALGVVLLLLLATAATVVLSVRGALNTHRSTIEIMHMMGSTDLQAVVPAARGAGRIVRRDGGAARGDPYPLAFGQPLCRAGAGAACRGGDAALWLAVAGADPGCGGGAGDVYRSLDGAVRAQEDAMIKRILAFLLLAWVLGFAWFALFLPQPAPLAKSDGVVVLTGGAGRIDRGLEVLEAKKARRMLISGVDLDVKPGELAAQYKRPPALFACCIDLGFRAVDTRSNGLETARWVSRNKIKTLRLVTHDWHMRRARLELKLALPDGVTVVEDAVVTQPSLFVLFKEYHKYWLRGLAALVGV